MVSVVQGLQFGSKLTVLKLPTRQTVDMSIQNCVLYAIETVNWADRCVRGVLCVGGGGLCVCGGVCVCVCSAWHSKQGPESIFYIQSEDILTKRGQNFNPRFVTMCTVLTLS